MNEHAYTLYPKLVHLTLCGQDEEGALEFIGTLEQREKAKDLEFMMVNN